MKRNKYLPITAMFLLSSCSNAPTENIYAQSKEIFASKTSSIVLLDENRSILVLNGQCEAVGGYKTRWCSQEETSIVSFTYALSISPRAESIDECPSKFLQVKGKTDTLFYGDGCYSIDSNNYAISKEETERMKRMAAEISKTISNTPKIPN